MSLYHCTHIDLVPGDMIVPGNWGRKILETGTTHKCWHREFILEAVRLCSYPHKPSRFSSCFACLSLRTISCYKSVHCSHGFIYEVDVVKPDAPMHKGDFNAVEPLPRVNKTMLEMADMYWRYAYKTTVKEWPDIECAEIVVASPLVVLQKMAEQQSS